MTDAPANADAWGRDDPPAVADEDLQPLPAALAAIAQALSDGDRIPCPDPSPSGRPGARDLPEVAALVREGWEPLPTARLDTETGLLPAAWPPEHRCWVHDRIPAFGVCSYGPGETFIEPEMRSAEREHWELIRTARSAGLSAPPPGRLWLVRSPWPGIGAGSLLLAIRQVRDTDGLGWDAVGMMRAAEQVLAAGEDALWARWSGRQADAARAWRAEGQFGAGIHQWVELGLRPTDLAVLTTSLSEGGAGIPASTVPQWCHAVTMGGEPRADDVSRITAWRGAGIPADAPVGRLASVMCERPPSEVRRWLEAGLTVEQIADWDADDLPRALRWRDAGFEAAEARELTLADPMLTPQEARAFDAAGIEPRARCRWVQAGFSPAEARAWTDLDVVAAEARVWRSLGRGPDEARVQREAGGPPLPADFEGGWAAFGTERDDVGFGVTDPPGTRGLAAQMGPDGMPFG